MHDHQDGKLDLVPMIDCIMLLLLFFILTSSFTTPEGVISSLLPPNGQKKDPPTDIPPSEIAIVAIPSELGMGRDAQDWQKRWNHLRRQQAIPAQSLVRVGGSEPFRLDGAILGARDAEGLKRQKQVLDNLHAYIRTELAAREVAGKPRDQQPPVNLHCFSGLPWKVALVCYDAVRSYEHDRAPELTADTPDFLTKARSVVFAPPAIRNVTADEAGTELMRLVCVR